MSTSEDPPQPQPTPESEGIPDHADDMSTAFTRQDRPTFSDSPPPLPGDTPQALDEHGVTAAEQREGESLEERLEREEPEESPGYENLEPGAEQSAEEAAMHELPDRDTTSGP